MATRCGNLVRSIALAALMGQGVEANAAIVTTVPETEMFTLNPAQATFKVSNNSTDPTAPDPNNPVIENINSGPQSAGPTLLNFNQFNPALGTLLGVTVSFQSAYQSTSTLSVSSGPFDNGTVGATDFFADGTFDFLLSGLGLIANQSSTQNANATCAITYTINDLNDAKQCGNTASNNGNFNGTTSGLSLAPFTGTGTFDLSAALTSALLPKITPDNGTGYADNSTFSGALDDGWGGSVSVVYTYDTPDGAVPEPKILYLLLAALGGFAFLPRRRR